MVADQGEGLAKAAVSYVGSGHSQSLVLRVMLANHLEADQATGSTEHTRTCLELGQNNEWMLGSANRFIGDPLMVITCLRFRGNVGVSAIPTNFTSC